MTLKCEVALRVCTHDAGTSWLTPTCVHSAAAILILRLCMWSTPPSWRWRHSAVPMELASSNWFEWFCSGGFSVLNVLLHVLLFWIVCNVLYTAKKTSRTSELIRGQEILNLLEIEPSSCTCAVVCLPVNCTFGGFIDDMIVSAFAKHMCYRNASYL